MFYIKITCEYLFLEVKEKFAYLEIGWENLACFTTDGDRSTDASKNCAAGRIWQEFSYTISENAMYFHCIIHHEALCCKFSSFEMKEVSDTDFNSGLYLTWPLETPSV